MEVHHHPDLHHKKKRFREFFLEFLMIFLAVTLGFLAENLREHITNNAKEKEYIRAFIRNVQDDTANLKGIIYFDSTQLKDIAVFLQLSHTEMKSDSNRKKFYRFAMRAFYNSASFISNNATLQQLKSTGDYRLIVKDHVSDSLSKYDTDIQGISVQSDFYTEYFKEILSHLDVLTDMSVYADSAFVKNGVFTDKPVPELSSDPGKIRTVFSKAFDFEVITQSYRNNYLKRELVNATRLITFLQKEYHIVND